MTFTSWGYPVFLLVVFSMYWAVPFRYRKYVLLVSGYVFYAMSGIWYPLFLAYVTILSYIFSKKTEWKWRHGILILFPLLVFKYNGFFIDLVNGAVEYIHHPGWGGFEKLALPIGLSFYTFSALSYVIDANQGKQRYSFIDLSVGISFFPCLISGPIERQNKLIPQLQKEKYFNYKQATYGLKKMGCGYFKKIVVADTLAGYVNQVYENIPNISGFALIIAAVLYSIEIYADFSGYTDIAIGTAKLFGIELTENFRQPYFSRSIKEFWNRWHISLSNWLRDYIYIPLGGNRLGSIRKRINLMLTFLVSGIWHGNNISFLAWGIGHGGCEVIEDVWPKKKTYWKYPQMLITFLIVTVLWVFFRAPTLNDAVFVLKSGLSGIENFKSYILLGFHLAGFSKYSVFVVMIEIFVLIVYDIFSVKVDVINSISSRKWYKRWPIYIIFMIAIVLLSNKGVGQQFVYGEF